jgi:hypothetical protein
MGKQMEKGGVMQNAVHQNQMKEAPRASSLYCRWVPDGRRPGRPLVAVWIDSAMRCFEQQFAPEYGSPELESEETLQDTLDDPGGAGMYVNVKL